MTVSNLGGPDRVIKIMVEAGKAPLCCCPKDPLRFYKRVQFALFQFLVYRSIVTLIGAIFNFIEFKPGFIVCTALAVMMFLFGFGSLAFFCKLTAYLHHLQTIH